MKTARGFTLLEMMVGIVLTGILIVILVNMLFNVNRSWDNSKDSVSRTQNTRAALEFMIKDIRMAGTGFSGTKLVTGGVPGNTLYPLHPTPGFGGDADTLTITGAFSGVQGNTTVATPSPADAIYVGDSRPFSRGDLIVITNGIRSNLFEITNDPGTSNILDHTAISPFNALGGHAQWPVGGYPIGTRVVKVDRVSYWLDASGSTKRLLRSVNGGTPAAVAFNSGDLQIVYRLKDGSETQSPPDPDDIASVVLEYVSAASGASPVDTMLVQVQPRVM